MSGEYATIVLTTPNYSHAASATSQMPDEPTMIVVTTFVAIFLVVGTAGNVLTMVVILKTKSLHIPSNFFILSLCCSDLISALVCSPLWLYRRTWGFHDWKWTEALCKFYWIADFTTDYATSFHIVSFAALRFVAIKRPFAVSKITKENVMIYTGCLWLISIAVAMPLINFMSVVSDRDLDDFGNKWPSCSICNEKKCLEQYNLYVSITSPMLFFLPELCVLVLSFCIAKALLKRRRWRKKFSTIYSVNDHMTPYHYRSHPDLPDVIYNAHSVCRNSSHAQEHGIVYFREHGGHETHPRGSTRTAVASQRRPLSRSHALEQQYQRERKTFTQLSLIVVAFIIGYIPQSVYLMWTSSANLNGNMAGADYWFGVIAYLCLRLSECMNPVMYNLGSSNIRNASKKLFKDIFQHN